MIGLSELAADALEALLRRLVIPIDIHRVGIGPGGLLLVAEPLIGEPAAGPGLHVLRIDGDRVVEIARRVLGVVDREIA